MAKIERKYLAHYINCAEPEGEMLQFERLGKDLEEYAPELSAQVDTKKNILGETAIMISGYEKTGEVGTYYADADTQLFDRLQSIIDDGKVMDALRTQVVEVKLWQAEEDGGYPAVMEDAVIEVKSYGGDHTGYQIPFAIHYTGKRQKGQFNIASKTFTPAQA